MKATKICITLCVVSALLGACAPGILYTDVTIPVVIDMHDTPRGERMVELSSKHIEEPITGAKLSAEWDSRAIGDAAQKGKLEEIYYADLRIFSLLGGIWSKQTIRVYGK